MATANVVIVYDRNTLELIGCTIDERKEFEECERCEIRDVCFLRVHNLFEGGDNE